MHGYEDITCHICNFGQPLENRADVQQMKGGGGQGIPMQNQPGNGPPQGWTGPGGGGPGQQHAPGGQNPMRYG